MTTNAIATMAQEFRPRPITTTQHHRPKRQSGEISNLTIRESIGRETQRALPFDAGAEARVLTQ